MISPSFPSLCQWLLVDCGPEYTLSSSRRCCKCHRLLLMDDSSSLRSSSAWLSRWINGSFFVIWISFPSQQRLGMYNGEKETRDVMAAVQETSKLLIWWGIIHRREGFSKHSCGERNAYFRPRSIQVHKIEVGVLQPLHCGSSVHINIYRGCGGKTLSLCSAEVSSSVAWVPWVNKLCRDRKGASSDYLLASRHPTGNITPPKKILS